MDDWPEPVRRELERVALREPEGLSRGLVMLVAMPAWALSKRKREEYYAECAKQAHAALRELAAVIAAGGVVFPDGTAYAANSAVVIQDISANTSEVHDVAPCDEAFNDPAAVLRVLLQVVADNVTGMQQFQLYLDLDPAHGEEVESKWVRMAAEVIADCDTALLEWQRAVCAAVLVVRAHT